MAAPRPPPVISVSVSAPAFYAPQKKFAPVVAPKPKVNPFRAGATENPPGPGAQRAQMGKVGEIPPPPPEDFPLPPPPLLPGDDGEASLGGPFPPPPPPFEEPFPPAPEEETFPSPPPPLEEEVGVEPPAPTHQPRGKVSSIDLEMESLSSLLDDMARNDPFKPRVSSGSVPPPAAPQFPPKPTVPQFPPKPTVPSAASSTAPLPPWLAPTSPPQSHSVSVSKTLSTQPRGPPAPAPPLASAPAAAPSVVRPPAPALTSAPTPTPKVNAVASKFPPGTPKFSPPAPGGPPHKKGGPSPPTATGSPQQPQPPSFTYAQQREKPRVQEKQRPVPPPAQDQVRPPGAPGPLTLREVEELEELTQQLMRDMEQPSNNKLPTDEYCGRCHQALVRSQPAVRALGSLFHVTCFTCHQCERQLQGQQFYSLEGAPYCEQCYENTLEKCSTCGQPITERMLRATGRAFHPQCFTCVVCACPLEGTSFIVDQANRPHCVPDYHRQYAPRCSVCAEPIMPEPGRDETVRVVALDKNFHMKCYKCEDCGKPLSIEADENGCFPLDGHVLCRHCHTTRAQT